MYPHSTTRQLSLETLESRLVMAAPIDTFDRTAVVKAYLDRYVPSLATQVVWTGNTSSCDAGMADQRSTDATLEMINYFRNMVGLKDVALDNAFSAKAQQAALMMQAQNSLSHTPPANWACYTAEGAEAAGRSNLYLGVTGPRAISGYIEDPGAGNTAAGHRRWILYPFTDRMGTGSTSRANALWVISPRVEQATPDWISWPPQGFVTKSLVFPRWSLSRDKADFAQATVSMELNGTSVPLTQNAVANGFGLNTLVWEPANLVLPAANADANIKVTVRNVLVNGQAQNFDYTVTAIDPVIPPQPALTVQLAATSILENSLSTPNFVTVSRTNADLTKALQINLSSSDTSVLTIPTTAIIPVGTASIKLPIYVVDDEVADGNQMASITVSALGHVSSNASVTVLDDEVVMLGLSLDSGTIARNGGATTGRVTRNTPTTLPLVVHLVSSDTTAAALPTTVTIPVGASSIGFLVTAVENTSAAGLVNVIITASSEIGSAQAGLAVEGDVVAWPWRNTKNPFDVNDDGFVSPIDVLSIINDLNTFGSRVLTRPSANEQPPPFLDVSSDGFTSPIDVLLVINFLNLVGAGEGESSSEFSAPTDLALGDTNWLDTCCLDTFASGRRRKFR